MRVVFGSVKRFFVRYPLAKGMLAYSIMWPTGNIIQQTIMGKNWGELIVVRHVFFFFFLLLLLKKKINFVKPFHLIQFRNLRLGQMCTIFTIWCSFCGAHFVRLGEGNNIHLAGIEFSDCHL